MSYPDPYEALEKNFHFLKTLNFKIAVTAFVHSRNQPVPGPNGRFKEDVVQSWCERMDVLVGKLSRADGLHPDHQDIIGSLHELCTKTIRHTETQLANQEAADDAEQKKLDDNRKKINAMARLAADREAKEKADALKCMQEEEKNIKAVERELAIKRQALRNAQKAADIALDDEDDIASISIIGDQVVPKSISKQKGEEEAHKKMDQVVHSTPFLRCCAACTKANKPIYTGPAGYSCNVCWKVKKSCTNGGRRHTCIKDEPASPAKATAKRKMYSTSGLNAIGTIEKLDEADIPQGVTKPQKTGAGATAQVRFDSTTATTSTRPTPRPIRKSTWSAKATPKVEDNSKLEINKLFIKLGQEFYAIGKACEAIGRTCKNIAETINLNA